MKFIIIDKEQINKLSKNRLLNIYKINRKYIFQMLAINGFDTSNGFSDIPWNFVINDLFHGTEFNQVLAINNNIKIKLNKIDNESKNSK